jgi:hypothetical protein
MGRAAADELKKGAMVRLTKSAKLACEATTGLPSPVGAMPRRAELAVSPMDSRRCALAPGIARRCLR